MNMKTPYQILTSSLLARLHVRINSLARPALIAPPRRPLTTRPTLFRTLPNINSAPKIHTKFYPSCGYNKYSPPNINEKIDFNVRKVEYFSQPPFPQRSPLRHPSELYRTLNFSSPQFYINASVTTSPPNHIHPSNNNFKCKFQAVRRLCR
jgi:hypothetical protein